MRLSIDVCHVMQAALVLPQSFSPSLSELSDVTLLLFPIDRYPMAERGISLQVVWVRCERAGGSLRYSLYDCELG